ncbi:hypothetical protein [Tenacibaculum agarivorans]|uniref:hypothetical protein n=1 Tax=Tenacibaculum agarivorans TaxID=1908389 RepID=UPI00094B91B8|nr:hypothetical protein [Tenacibaculum agarivorans]
MVLKKYIEEALVIDSFHEKHSEILSYLKNFLESEQIFIDHLDKLNSLDSNIDTLTKEILSNMVKYMSSYKPFSFFEKINAIYSDIKEIESINSEKKDFFYHITEKLCDSFSNCRIYPESPFLYLILLFEIQKFLSELKSIMYAAEQTINNLSLNQHKVDTNNSIIDIYIISEKESLDSFSSFLNLINNLYSGLLQAFEIHYDDYPLNIINIQSGSVWTKLFGNTNIIELIKDLIFGLGHYIRDLQTGKISKEEFDNRIDKAQALLDLRTKAIQLGVDEKNILLIDKVFNQTINNISKSLPKSTTEILIDEKPLFSLSDKELKMIEEKKKLMNNN